MYPSKAVGLDPLKILPLTLNTLILLFFYLLEQFWTPSFGSVFTKGDFKKNTYAVNAPSRGKPGSQNKNEGGGGVSHPRFCWTCRCPRVSPDTWNVNSSCIQNLPRPFLEAKLLVGAGREKSRPARFPPQGHSLEIVFADGFPDSGENFPFWYLQEGQISVPSFLYLTDLEPLQVNK